jgi:hypothetical protein
MYVKKKKQYIKNIHNFKAVLCERYNYHVQHLLLTNSHQTPDFTNLSTAE